jgi:hypothetical protein
MGVRSDLQAALSSWSSTGDEAYVITDWVFDRIIAIMRKHSPALTLVAAELLIADAKRDLESSLFNLMHNSIDCDSAIDVFINRFLGGDD